MKERPILFNAEMVKAILAGNKTQTRRIVKRQPPLGHQWQGWVLDSTCSADVGSATWASGNGPLMQDVIRAHCPLGKVGDRLWVRETFGNSWHHAQPPYFYRASDAVSPHPDFDGWKPSIHMPRAASRITLEITAVRVERLQDISGNDTSAEGITEDSAILSGQREGSILTPAGKRELYEALWESIYGTESWATNPWVWVIEFKRVAP